ncbi:hypothetical protein MWU60_07805 [Yoonia sp. F2084L]|uniref:hypothetical protein n=1 Tax=Yoonia sp. F2084L TaxID=2926419 RepID=UPI001FF5BE48|nr:hypothetical protein [Yoonia sp. F2084L]MCK0095472.1 hypothetical protein [Yoonia sp. F2084L]
MKCDLIIKALHLADECQETSRGSKVRTHCLYPSFEAVFVYVQSHPHGFMVTDAGDALNRAWLHGRDESFGKRHLKQSARHFGCEFKHGQLSILAPSDEWLAQAIAAVANAAAEGVNASIRHTGQSNERKLISRVYDVVKGSPYGFDATLDYSAVGKSGKTHHYDMLLSHNNDQILINVVVPHANSIAAKYLALSDATDVRSRLKYAVYDKELTREDKVLLSNVADVLPYKAIVETSGKALLVH